VAGFNSIEGFLTHVFWGILGIFNGKELLSVPNLLGAFLIAILVFLIWYNKPGKSLIAFLLPKKVWQNKSAILDVLYFLVIQAIKVSFIAIAMAYISNIGGSFFSSMFEQLFGKVNVVTNTTTLAKVIYTLLLFIAIDFGFFITHYLSHKVQILWIFHKVHHSATALNPFTAMRFHPLDMAWNMLGSAVFIAFVSGVAMYSFVGKTESITIFGQNAVIALSYITTHHFRHSHIWLHYPKWLGWLLISPAQHQIHHSIESKHINKNMGYLLSCWDKLFKTGYNPKSQEHFEVGITDMPDKGFYAHKSVMSLLLSPFAEVWNYLKVRC